MSILPLPGVTLPLSLITPPPDFLAGLPLSLSQGHPPPATPSHWERLLPGLSARVPFSLSQGYPPPSQKLPLTGNSFSQGCQLEYPFPSPRGTLPPQKLPLTGNSFSQGCQLEYPFPTPRDTLPPRNSLSLGTPSPRVVS